MPLMRMVQTPPHQVVHVIPVRHRLVPAPRPMHVLRLVPRPFLPRRAPVRVLLGNLQPALVEMIPVQRVQAPVVQVIHMLPVPDRCVPAPLSMNVRVIAVDLVPQHGSSCFPP